MPNGHQILIIALAAAVLGGLVGAGAGYQAGHDDGWDEGNETGYQDGYDAGWADGNESGWDDGYDAGNESGYQSGFEDGLREGNAEGYQSGYEEGYQCGAFDASTQISADLGPALLNLSAGLEDHNQNHHQPTIGPSNPVNQSLVDDLETYGHEFNNIADTPRPGYCGPPQINSTA